MSDWVRIYSIPQTGSPRIGHAVAVTQADPPPGHRMVTVVIHTCGRTTSFQVTLEGRLSLFEDSGNVPTTAKEGN